MIYEVDANLLECPPEYPLDGIIHSCNCFHIFGGGIAKRIKDKFPEAYEEDLKTLKGHRPKLGVFSVAVLPSNFHIYNMYGQFDFGGLRRNTSYDAFCEGLGLIENHAIGEGLKTLGLPKNMGCVLGGGDWRIVRVIIKTIFENSALDLYICNYEG